MIARVDVAELLARARQKRFQTLFQTSSRTMRTGSDGAASVRNSCTCSNGDSSHGCNLVAGATRFGCCNARLDVSLGGRVGNSLSYCESQFQSPPQSRFGAFAKVRVPLLSCSEESLEPRIWELPIAVFRAVLDDKIVEG